MIVKKTTLMKNKSNLFLFFYIRKHSLEQYMLFKNVVLITSIEQKSNADDIFECSFFSLLNNSSKNSKNRVKQ